MEERELAQRLEELKNILADIRKNTGSSWIAFRGGVLRGAGWVAGVTSVVAVLGWILNLLGIVPGLEEQAEYFRRILEGIQS